MAGKPGKTAPRLLQDLLAYDPRYEQRAGRNLLTSSPPQHDPDAAPIAAVPLRNCRHSFSNKEEQSQLPVAGEDPDHTTIYKVASFCSRCRWHFDLVVDLRDDGGKNKPCRKSNRDWPLHHFLFQGSEGQNEDAVVGAHIKPRTFKFTCSALKCPAVLQIRVTPPRFSDSDVRLLTDRAALRRRWETAKQIAGDRADASMARPVDAPDFLNTYLQDSLNPQKGKARIPLLNRKFLKTFGKDCDGILKKLGFTGSVEIDEDGAANDVWHLPKPDPPRHPLDAMEPTLRNIIEDARYELNSIILKYPEPERSGARHVPQYPTASRSHMERALGCDGYDKAQGRTETRSTNREEDHPYYAGLGAVGDFADHLLLFAYHRQVAVDDANHPYYFECLQDLAVGRRSEALQSEVAMLASQGCFNRSEVRKAYEYFGIEPAHASIISDEHITGVFRSRLSDISSSLIQETQKQLRIIGQARNSEMIKREASDAIETYDQALSWLGLEKDQADDFVPTMFSLKVEDNPGSKDTARKAVRIIAEHRKSQRLLEFLEKGSMADAEMDVAEAYLILAISERSAKLDLQVLEDMVSAQIQSNPEDAAKLQEALAKIRQDQENTYGQSEYAKQPAVNYPLETWPVGCCNIGNTCYLNSVLQFLFTVKPLRDMVLNCDQHLQELTPEALETKRVGRTAVSPARAETGQRFVRELRRLFERMIDSPTHNIRPERTLAALALTRGENAADILVENTTTHSGLGEIEGVAISGPAPPPKGPLGSRPPTPADSVMGDNNDAKDETCSMNALDLTATSNEPNGAATSRPEPPSRAPPPVPPRPQAAAEKKPQVSAENGFRKIEEVARQQDAAEILNNVFDLLSCAFKGESTLRDGEQFDMIKRLFFSDVTVVRDTNGKTTSKSDLQDNIHVSTKDRDRTLHAALDDEFGQKLEDGVTKYEFFEEASPIQIINVRRLQYEASSKSTRKDNSHLALEKVLYLDRYLKSTKSLSVEQLQALRDEQWRLQTDLRSLEALRKKLKETPFENVDLPGVLGETAGLIDKFKKAETPDTFPTSPEVNPDELANQLSQRANELRPEIPEIDGRMDALEKEIDSVFEVYKDHPYRLHAIFTHAGSHTGGHYWIYIYDFQNDIWRKYNDETVTEETEEDVLKKVERTNPPTSTGIVYVREDVANQYTQAVCRQPETSQAENGQGDVKMKDVDTYSQPVVNMDVEYQNLQVINGVEKEDSPPVELIESVEVGGDPGVVSAKALGKRNSDTLLRSPSPGKKSRMSGQADGAEDVPDALATPFHDPGSDQWSSRTDHAEDVSKSMPLLTEDPDPDERSPHSSDEDSDCYDDEPMKVKDDVPKLIVDLRKPKPFS